MKFRLGVLTLCVVVVAIIADSAEIGPSDRWARLSKLWKQYKARYNLAYPSQEEETFRFELFGKRLQQVEEHNARNLSWTRAINHLTVLTEAELGRLTARGPQVTRADELHRSPQELGILVDDVDDSPANFSWLEIPNVVGPAKNQGRCGSCWAFATVALVESRERLSGGNLTNLSEQQLVDCITAMTDRDGCSGNSMDNAAELVIKSGGLQTEQDYPYSSRHGISQECKFNPSKVYSTTSKIKSFSYLNVTGEDELKRVLYKYGPVSIIIKGDFSIDFFSYSGGVYQNEKSNYGDYYHAILLVGYGTDERGTDYWLLKNSWSDKWGIEGFFKIVRNRNFFTLLARPSVVLEHPLS